jgi:hypothetical protein
VSRYPDGMVLRPSQSWPGPFPTEHVRSPFSAPLSTTLSELDRELWYLGTGSRNAPSVLAMALSEGDFRKVDGLPRANARPDHPGVVLYIESMVGPLSYPCAKFDSWTDNLRAITLGLNGLRRLERYGITSANEQYAGWKALPAAGAVAATGAEDAEAQLRRVSGLADETDLNRVYRVARANTHTDRGGDRAGWDAVEAAGDVLRRHGRLT